MGQLATNLKTLRKQRGITQAQLAEVLGLNRPVIGAYEEERAEPKISVLQAMASFFGISVDELVGGDMVQNGPVIVRDVQVLPVVVDAANRERVPLVPVKAAAGYLSGFNDPAFIGQLDVFDLPFRELRDDRTYRMFQIEGDSMLPIPSGSYIISSYVEDPALVKDGETYIVVSEAEGIVFKRVFRNGNALRLVSDNTVYEPFSVPLEEVREMWKAGGYVCFDLP